MAPIRKFALLVNTIAPYRVPLYEGLAKHFDITVFHGGSEPNRSWAVRLPPSIRVRKVFTIILRRKRLTGTQGVRDANYVHLNLGLLYWLPRFSPDVVVSSEMGLRTCIALLYGSLFHKPVWVWWGGTLHTESNLGGVKSIVRRLVARWARHWISYGASSTEYLLSLDVPRESILQIQNCVPEGNFSSLAGNNPWFAEEAGPVLLSVGQLTDRKGLDRLISSCGRLQAEGHDFTLVLVGHGPRRTDLQSHAEAVGLRNFILLPEQTQETLNAMYHACDVFVFPTLEDVWGLVVNEAVLCGTPVLCSQYAGCAMELIDPQNVFDPISEASCDAALRRALTGGVTPADPARLRRCDEVADAIVHSVLAGKPVMDFAEIRA